MTEPIPLSHRKDPDSSKVAAEKTAAGARRLRKMLCTKLKHAARQGITGDEASVFTDLVFPGRFVEYAGRRRLSDLCDPQFGDNAGAFGQPTRHRRLNRRGNLERVILHRDYYNEALDSQQVAMVPQLEAT